MAFNPFTTFRKYQKIWMATILLLCMLTFVLCTGVGQGDLSDILLRVFRPRGTAYAAIDSRKIYSQEFYELKEQRNIANEYMRAASKRIAAKMDDFLKPENIKKFEKENPKDREQVFQIQRMRSTLELILRRPRFGDTGVKIDDLVDFKLWLVEADRIGIELNNDAVQTLTTIELGGRDWYAWGSEVHRIALQEVRGHHKLNEALVLQTLRNEYRVRLAQRVLGYAGGTRLALTPGQLWDLYKEKRVEYRVSLLPMHVEDFVPKIGSPDEVEQGILFAQLKNIPYDPTAEKSGLVRPPQTKVAYVSADPNSDYYKKLSKAAVRVQAAPLPAPHLSAWQVVGASLATEVRAHDIFENVRNRYRTVDLTEEGAHLAVATYMMQKDAIGPAALVLAGARMGPGLSMLDPGVAMVPGHLSVGLLRYAKQVEAGAQEDMKKRAPAYATLTMLGATHQGLAIPFVWDRLSSHSQYLPMSIVRNELLEFVERDLARKWVQTHMQVLKRKLEETNVTTRAAIQRVLDNYGQGIGLEQVETKDFYDKHNIHEAKELKPFHDSFMAYVDQINSIEGRSTNPESMLKPGDFWKLFFDGSESFSATGSKYQVKPWPPAVRIQSQIIQQARMIPDDPRFQEILRLAENAGVDQPVMMQLYNDAERPFLFCRTADKPTYTPEKLDDTIRPLVIEAWKRNKARETILLPRARKIAEAVEKSGTPRLQLADALDSLKKEFDVKREIPTIDVMPWVPTRSGGGFGGGISTAYQEFDLPRGLVEHPRKDMAKELLNLYDLQEPLKIDYPPLDEINKALYEAVNKDKEPKGKYVQILTNKPRSVFYVVAVVAPPNISHFDFNRTVREAFGHDQFFERGQNEMAKRMREDLIRQLRRDHKVEEPSADVRKNFDSDAVDR